MPKQPSPPAFTPEIIQTPLEEVMRTSMMPYAEYVILERALPRVEDGLKPVQRRILYTMSELGVTPDKPHRKCARIVGDCLGKFHPHGDTSVYDALVRLAQPFSMRGMLVDGHGNFGSVDGDSAAAMRYTEARMAPLALQMLRDIEKDTVPFRLNFDDTLKEPNLLPARYPNLLVNGASGIAVGLATNIPPHNLRETCAAVAAQIDNPDITTRELMRHIPAPDFPTGGILLDTPELSAAYETGRGKLQLRARVQIEKGSAGRTLLVITEVPYQVSKAQMLEKILKLSEEKKAALGGIHDIRDESDRTGMRAVIELKRDVDPQRVLAYLYKYSDLQVTFGVNMVAIAQGKPVQMGLKTMIAHFIAHQKNVVTRRTRYELEQARARAHVLEGLIIAVDHLDEVLAIIRSSKNGKEARARLIERFALTEIQAQAILDMRLQRLTGLEILALRKEYEELLKLIDRLESILKSERKLMGVIKGELAEIAAQFGDERRTQLVRETPEEAPVLDETPVPEEAVIFYTRGGQLRRMHPRFYEKLELPKSEDEMPRWLLRTQTDHTLLFFTNRGNCYPLSVGALGESNRPKDRGVLLSGVLAGLADGERAVALFDAAPGALAGMPDFLFFTERGMVKRTAAAEYDVRSKRFAALTLKKEDALLAVCPLDEHADVLLVSGGGMAIRFAVSSVPATGRVSGGVKGMALEAGDGVLLGAQLRNSDQVLLFTERGYAKRCMGVEFDAQGRNGKGVKCFAFNKNGATGTRVAAAAVLGAACAFSVKQKSGALTPMTTEEIVFQARADKGKPYVLALMDDVVTEVIL